MPDPCTPSPGQLPSLDLQADAIRALALVYDRERWAQQRSWIERIWPGHETLAQLRGDLVQRLSQYARHGGNLDICIPVPRDGRPPLQVPVLDFFLIDKDSLDVAMTIVQLGGVIGNSTVRKLGRMACATPVGEMPELFSILVEWVMLSPGLDWKQTIREAMQGGQEQHVDDAMQRHCPQFHEKLVRLAGRGVCQDAGGGPVSDPDDPAARVAHGPRVRA